MSNRRTAALAAGALLVISGCGGGGDTGGGAEAGGGEDAALVLSNCEQERSFPSPAERIYVYDGGMIAMVLALGAQDQVAGISGLQDDRGALATVYGQDVVDALPVASEDRPTLENVIAQRPDLMFAGWNYGWNEDDNLTPDGLAGRDIAAYTLTESCRQTDGESRGIVDPWEALRTDLTNLGRITGREEEAEEVVEDVRTRLDALADAPRAEEPPTVFLFDSGTDAPFSSGSFGGPQGIIEAAGARNATEDVDDTWTTVSWERVVASQPDFIAMVDYPGQTFAEKVRVLQSNPATRDLEAVREERFLNLPYAAWVSSPLNVDAAEQLRAALEGVGLVPETDIEAPFDLEPARTP